jgi:hypothetical protein
MMKWSTLDMIAIKIPYSRQNAAIVFSESGSTARETGNAKNNFCIFWLAFHEMSSHKDP